MKDDKNAASLHALAKLMCLGLVSKPSKMDVSCARMSKSRTIVIDVGCDPVDFGKLIGRLGWNFKSMQTIMHRHAFLLGEVVEFSVPDPNSGERSRYTEFRKVQNWSPDRLLSTIRGIGSAVLANEFECEVVNGKHRAVIEMSLSEHEFFASDAEFKVLANSVQRVIEAHGRNEGWEVEFKMVRP